MSLFYDPRISRPLTFGAWFCHKFCDLYSSIYGTCMWNVLAESYLDCSCRADIDCPTPWQGKSSRGQIFHCCHAYLNLFSALRHNAAVTNTHLKPKFHYFYLVGNKVCPLHLHRDISSRSVTSFRLFSRQLVRNLLLTSRRLAQNLVFSKRWVRQVMEVFLLA